MTASQSVVLNNTGNESLTIFRAIVSGTGFSISGLVPPLTLSPNQSITLTTIFAPQSSGIVSGGIAFEYSRSGRAEAFGYREHNERLSYGYGHNVESTRRQSD
jgi:hypothetical protein